MTGEAGMSDRETELLLKLSAGVCFSPASPLDLLGWSLDRATVQMLPAPFLHPMCFSGTRPAAAIPSSPKAFPLQRANRKDLCGFEHVLEWGGFLCLL